jgi:hypothetical protein
MYRAQGFAHATAVHHLHRLSRAEEGQGTVEYIGLVLLMAAVMGVVAARTGGPGARIGKSVVDTITNSITDVGGK